MRNKRTDGPMPLFQVALPRSDKKIFDLKSILHLSITIETLNTSAHIGQCYRCQKFGHSQSNCTATTKCVKCGKNHCVADCLLLKTESPTCANCNGQHVASYRGCPNAPKPRKITEYSQTRSYAAPTANKPQPNNKHEINALETIALAIQNMTLMLQEIKNQNTSSHK